MEGRKSPEISSHSAEIMRTGVRNILRTALEDKKTSSQEELLRLGELSADQVMEIIGASGLRDAFDHLTAQLGSIPNEVLVAEATAVLRELHSAHNVMTEGEGI